MCGVQILRGYVLFKFIMGLYVLKFPNSIKNKCIDISLACEIFEHLPKEAGFRLLTELERVTGN